jgi:hypothetical protein
MANLRKLRVRTTIMMLQMIPLTDLHPHPGNPRLSPREDIVEQIAAQLNGRMDEAHALIVRQIDEGYQIIAGHHRKLAAEQAGLTEVPCWVREISDEVRCDPFREIADALILANNACRISDFSLDEQVSLTTVSITFQDQTFSGERIAPKEGKIDWLKGWINISALPDALALWDIPVCPDLFAWRLRCGAHFMRADRGIFSQRQRYIPRELPDRPDDPDFKQYSGTDCIYFVQAQQLRLIKIGFSSNVPKRLAALKTGCPDSLELLNIIPGGAQMEKALHQRFSEQRVRGEWFTPTAAMMALIKGGDKR